MSSQKGNLHRSRPQKHKNATAFKNELHHDQYKKMNKMEIIGVCQRCKDIIGWRIQYSKYKPLTVPKKCVKCERKAIRYAYHVVCLDCASASTICAKCGTSDAEDKAAVQTPADFTRLRMELDKEIKTLPERKRRTILRKIEKGEETLKDSISTAQQNQKKDLDDLDDFDQSDLDTDDNSSDES